VEGRLLCRPAREAAQRQQWGHRHTVRASRKSFLENAQQINQAIWKSKKGQANPGRRAKKSLAKAKHYLTDEKHNGSRLDKSQRLHAAIRSNRNNKKRKEPRVWRDGHKNSMPPKKEEGKAARGKSEVARRREER